MLGEALIKEPLLPASVAALATLAETDPSVEIRFRAKKLLADVRAGASCVPSAALAPAPAQNQDQAQAQAQAQNQDPSTGRVGQGPTRAPVAPGLGELRQHLDRLPPGSATSSVDPVTGRTDDARGARLALLRAFAAAHRSEGVEELLEGLSREQDPVVLAAGIGLVGTHGRRHQIGALRRFLTDASPRVVASAVEAAGMLDADAALPMILSLLIKDDNRVRANVLMVLDQTRRPEMLAYLAQMSSKFEESYRASALWCMGRLAGETIEEMLVSMICRETVPDLLKGELELIGKAGTRRCIGAMTAYARENPSRQEAVTRAIDVVCARLGIDAGERRSLEGAQAGSSPGGLGAAIRRLTRGIRLPAGLAPASGSVRSTRPEFGVAGAGVGARAAGRASEAMSLRLGLAALVLVGIGFVSLYFQSTAGPGEAPRTQAVAIAQPARVQPANHSIVRPGDDVSLEGRVGSRYGPALTLTRDYQHYAITYPDVERLGEVKAGDRVRVKGAYAGWDSLHGVVHLRGKTLEVLQ